MASIATKFGIGDTAYTFDGVCGIIHRAIVRSIAANTSNFNTEIMYELTPSSTNGVQNASIPKSQQHVAEQDLYTDVEVKDLANIWLIEKSVSIFSNAGL